MLPTPALSSTRRGAFHYNVTSGRSRSFDYHAALRSLSGRSRLTNLGVLLLTAFGCTSFLYNLAFIFSSSSAYSYSSGVGIVGYAPPGSILATIRRDETLEHLSHLIVVPGHAIWSGSKQGEVLDEELWTLEDYQRGGGRISAFVDHIKQG
ncbi:hypothetical protein J3R83DRAFT_3937 [Lanmaoa asiatica]|nr:hypothetical protein J3R83DRAFT_3937 [Lanmaoa asiatica]